MGFPRTLLLIFLLFASSGLAALNRPIAFAPAQSFPSGINAPGCIATGDFNRDGKADLVVSNTFNSVAVFIGNGNGTFKKPTLFTLSFYVTGCMAVGDFNGDGKLDFAVVGGDSVGNGLALFLGKGDGTFTGPTYLKTELAGGSIYPAVGDFNGDHILDLFVGGNGASALLLGTGAGSFSFGTPVGAGGFGVAVGDFNHDGKLDAAGTYPLGSSAGFSVSLGNGDGTFQPPVNYGSGSLVTNGIVAGDFNNDKKLDLAVGYNNTTAVSVYLGNGDGTFGAPQMWLAGVRPDYLATADFNQDGNLDIAASDFGGDGVTILQGKGNGTFPTAVDNPTGSQPAYAAVADFNHDGSPDIAVANHGSNTVSVLLNASGTFLQLSSSVNPSKAGQVVKFTVVVKGSLPKAAIPTGSVVFKDGSAVLGKTSLMAGHASFSTAALIKGHHNITVTYSGSALFNPNVSKALVQTVQ